MEKMTTSENLKQRIQKENELMTSRTNMFLVLNGLGAIAVGIGTSSGGVQLITSVGVMVNVLWIIGSIQCLAIISRLTNRFVEVGVEDDPAEQLVQSVLGRTLILRPNALFHIYIPFIITSAWIIGLSYL